MQKATKAESDNGFHATNNVIFSIHLVVNYSADK